MGLAGGKVLIDYNTERGILQGGKNSPGEPGLKGMQVQEWLLSTLREKVTPSR